VTDDDAIRFNYRIRSVRTADYHRRFHAYEYTFLENVRSPERLVFHQMASDYYNTVLFDRFYAGDRTGLRSEGDREPGQIGYQDVKIPFEDSWLAIDDLSTTQGITKARRGILSLTSTLNGWAFPAFLHLYSSKGKSALFDLSSESVARSYKKGDVVKGELEFILPPKNRTVYWGDDSEWGERLDGYEDNAWQAVADEYRHNVQMKPVAHVGELIENYPIEVRAASGDVLAELTIPRGGIGHVPIIVRDVPGGGFLRTEYFVEEDWLPIGAASAYQGVRNAKGLLDCVFNIARPVADLDCGWRIRILQSAE
jgi:hypothetical protein